jgi:fructokinase
MGLARLGLPAGLFTAIAEDRLGDRLAQDLAREGVDPAFLRRKPLKTTLALVAVGADGGARYSFYGEGCADRAVTEADLPALDGVSGLLFGCLSLLSEPTGSSYLALAQRAAAAGEGRPLVTLDPNIRPTIEPDMAVWRARVDDFAACADLVKVSAEDLEALHPGASHEEAAARWRAMGPSVVFVTEGGEGAAGYGAFGAVRVPAQAVAVVDTVGAGDSFLAALVSKLHESGGATPGRLKALTAAEAEIALGFATRAAALTCARRGADLPTRAELSGIGAWFRAPSRSTRSTSSSSAPPETSPAAS